MYCSCSNKNNYEVISLCDVKKFSEKNGPFNRNLPWTQFSVSDILILNCNNLSIEKIEKIYINVSIMSTKIIETPISPGSNSEGMTLTGKKLLIDGFICSKIIYTSLTKEQSIYTSNFTVPFCTYIVIEPNVDIFNDKYCIKTCIEDVFLSLIDCKNIFQNVTLFLFAEKTSITCPSPQIPKEDCTIPTPPIFPALPPCDEPIVPDGIVPNISNVIISKNSSNNVLGQVSFNASTKKLQASSTSNRPSNTLPHNAYFIFTLRDCNYIIKKKALIKSEEISNNFGTTLNNTNFKYGDIIELEVLEGRTAIISNFPTAGEEHILGARAEIGVLVKEFYQINYNGLSSYTPNPPITTPSLPNIIKINAVDNRAIISIGFDTENFMLISTAINVIADRTTNPSYTYINFKLSKPDGTTVVNVQINSLASAIIAIEFLIKLLFDFNDIIELTYSPQAMSRVTITNLPSLGQDHTPASTVESFRITPSGLIKL